MNTAQQPGSPETNGVEMQEFDVLFPEGYDVVVGGHTFTLRPFTLKQLRSVTQTCDALVRKFSGLWMDSRSHGDNADVKFIEGIPDLVIEFVDDVSLLIAESLRMPKEYVEDNLTGSVASRMLLGIMEINDIGEMTKNFQDALGQIFPRAEQPESTEEPVGAEAPAGLPPEAAEV